MATAPMPTVAQRAAPTSSCSVALPLRRTLTYRSCAKDEDEARVRPATTARMVAKATAEMTASRMAPPVDPAPPPIASARSGAAVLPALLEAVIVPGLIRAAAPKPSAMVIR